MTIMKITRKPSRYLAASLAAVGLLAFGGPVSAQNATVFSAPADMCAWDWASPTTPWLLAALKREGLLELSAVEMAKTCPEKLCEVRWGGYAVPEDFPENGGLVQEMLCELSLRQLFFEDIIAGISAVCPDAAAQMVDLAPAAGEACPPWTPIESLGGGGAGGAVPLPDDDFADDTDDTDNAPPEDDTSDFADPTDDAPQPEAGSNPND